MGDQQGTRGREPGSRTGISPRELRHREAKPLEDLDLEHLDRAELRALVPASTWWEPAAYWLRLPAALLGLALSVIPVGCLIWTVVRRNLLDDASGPPRLFGWCVFILLTLPLLHVGSAIVTVCLRRSWTRLDASGITLGIASWKAWSNPSRTVRWNDCGEFSLRTIPTVDEPARTRAECNHVEGPVVLNTRPFGDPPDLVTIANAYRSVHRSPEQL